MNPWQDVQTALLHLWDGAGEPLRKGERLCGAPSLSGHPRRHPLNMAPSLVIQSIAALQQFAVETLQNQGCKQSFMTWGAQS